MKRIFPNVSWNCKWVCKRRKKDGRASGRRKLRKRVGGGGPPARREFSLRRLIFCRSSKCSFGWHSFSWTGANKTTFLFLSYYVFLTFCISSVTFFNAAIKSELERREKRAVGNEERVEGEFTKSFSKSPKWTRVAPKIGRFVIWCVKRCII